VVQFSGSTIIDLIREVLADGMVPSQELEDRVVAAGISRRTYDRARPKAGVRSKQIGRQHYSYLNVEPLAPTASQGNASKNTKQKANRKTQDAKDVTSGRQHKSRSSGRQNAIQDAKPSNYVEKEKDPSLGNGTGLNSSETGLDSLLPDFSLYPPDPDATGLVGFRWNPIAQLDPCGSSKIEVFATDDRADEQCPVSALTPEPTAELVPASTAGPARDVEPDHLACFPEPSCAVGPERADKGVWTIEDMFRLALLIEDLHRDLKLWKKVESKEVGPGPDDEGIVEAMLRVYRPRKKTRGRRTIWDTIAVRHYEQFVRGIEDGTITEERVFRVLPVLFKTEEVYREQLARAEDTRKLPRDVLARTRDIAFYEALEWAGLAKLRRNHPDRCQPPAETPAFLLDPEGSSCTSGFASNPTSSSDRSPAEDSNHEGDTSGQADHAMDQPVAEASDPDDRADEQCPVSAPVLELAAELTPALAPVPTPAPVPEPSPGPTPAPTTEPPLPPPSWSELSSQRWGPDDPTPGIIIDRPDRDRLRAVLESIPDHSAAAEREAIQAESRVERGLPAEASDALSAPVSPGPALALYRLIRDHYDPADRPVLTPDGPGQLWQMFAERAGVILDTAPERVTFFDPNLITSARPPGEAFLAGDDGGPGARGPRLPSRIAPRLRPKRERSPRPGGRAGPRGGLIAPPRHPRPSGRRSPLVRA
jgi:hypothetical protein